MHRQRGAVLDRKSGDYMVGGSGDGYDVVMRKIPDIKPSNDKKKTTDGAELIGSAVMKHIITDYQNQNPDTHVNRNECAFQGRVGPNK